MATSQNGWVAGSREQLGIKTFTVPGSSALIPLRPGPAAVVLLYVAHRFDREVEDIDTRNVRGYDVPDDWGYAERLIRGSETTLSNHASGTAIDLNSVQHPLGVAGTFTRSQVMAIQTILRDVDRVVRWGGDYSGRPDEMHFEINADYDAVDRVARRLTTYIAASPIPDLEDELSAAEVQQITDAIASALKTVRGDVGYVRDQIRGDISVVRGDLGLVRDQVRGDVGLVRDQIRGDITALPAAVLDTTIPDPATGKAYTVADWLVYANLKAGTAADLTAALTSALTDAGVPDPDAIAAQVATRLTVTTKETA